MPCHHPLQANFHVRADGKKDVRFSNVNAFLFDSGKDFISDSTLTLPCGRCMGCRLERSRQWAVRCMHEAQMWENCCFLTLTYSPDELPLGGTLVKKDLQDFMKRFRRSHSGVEPLFCHKTKQFGSDFPIRFFACGEYGEMLSRPHYHLIVFNYDFKDKVLWKVIDGVRYFVSDILSALWGKGHCVIGDVSFDSCAYVARYCTKKITGDKADSHYGDRQPEFMTCSLKPAIGRVWLDRFGKTDVFSHDYVVTNGVKCKPPRYYDKCFESIDPEAFDAVKMARQVRGELKAHDNTHARLKVKEQCLDARMKNFSRILEKI